MQAVEDVIRLAYKQHKSSDGPLTLLKVLAAYKTLLQQGKVMATDDTLYYRFLLKMSLDSEADWWKKFDKVKKVCASLR